jgi:hypothetical protein
MMIKSRRMRCAGNVARMGEWEMHAQLQSEELEGRENLREVGENRIMYLLLSELLADHFCPLFLSLSIYWNRVVVIGPGGKLPKIVD